MKIYSITANLINKNSGNFIQSNSNDIAVENRIQTSIYNKNGLTLPFGACRFKPLNICEENCVVMLRKIKDGTRQRFLQGDVNEIMASLRQEKDPEVMQKFLGDLIGALQETQCSKESFKHIVKLTAGKSYDEQDVLLGFVDHELKNAVEPLKSFTELSAESKEALMPFLKRISCLNSSEGTTEALYDTFRTLVYAEEDMSKLSGDALNKYKIDTCRMFKDNLEYFEKAQDTQATSVAKDIYYYFVDNMV